MYKKFFALKERPFKLVPNPEYYYLSRSHEEAMAHLTYAMAQGDGFVVITGEVGTGKTTLCRVFLQNLDDQTEVAYIFNPKMGPKHLLKAIVDEFDIAVGSEDAQTLVDALNGYLIQKKVEGKRVILLVDEAQNLARDVLEQLRLLSNLETNTYKLLQIILVGQPELSDALDSYELRQLGQRITLSCHLKPLTALEVREYIEHRIHVAASHPNLQFTPAAYRNIYAFSRGIPRLINIACDRTLLTAFGLGKRKISGNIARTAIRELSSRGGRPRKGWTELKRPVPLLAMASLALLLLFVVLRGPVDPVSLLEQIGSHPLRQREALPENPETAINTATSLTSINAVTPPAVPADMDQSLDGFLQEMDGHAARHLALKSVMERWNTPADILPEIDALEDDLTFFRRAAAENGLSVLRIGCRFELMKKLNLPAIVAIDLPQSTATGFVTLDRYDGDTVTLARAGRRRSVAVAESELRSRCAGSIFLVYKDFIAHGGVIPRSKPHESVIMLKMYLQELGYADIEINPYFDRATERAITQIQKNHGLRPDGIVGPLTKIVIYNEKNSHDIPHITHRQ
jgi:general secretion pathway protein A